MRFRSILGSATAGAVLTATALVAAGIATALFLTERAVEKHINSVFSKLQLSGEKDAHRRVKAVLLFLSDQS